MMLVEVRASFLVVAHYGGGVGIGRHSNVNTWRRTVTAIQLTCVTALLTIFAEAMLWYYG